MITDTQQATETVIELTDEQVSAALAQFDVTESVLQKVRKCKELTVEGPDDKKGLKKVQGQHKKVRKLRLDIEKKRKDLIRPALDFQNAVNTEAKRLTAEIEPAEKHLKSELDRIEKEKQEILARQVKDRRQKLVDAGFRFDGRFYSLGTISLHPSALEEADDETIDKWVKDGKAEAERLAEEERQRKEEAERIEKEKQDLERQRREIEKQKAEMEAQKKKQEQAEQPPKMDGPAPTTAKETKPPQRPVTPPGSGRDTPPGGRVHRQSHRPAEASTGGAPTFEDGFTELQKVILKTLKDGELPNGEKITRRSLHSWVKSLKPQDFKPPF